LFFFVFSNVAKKLQLFVCLFRGEWEMIDWWMEKKKIPNLQQ